MITITLTKDQAFNIRQFIIAGVKSPQVAGEAIIIAAELLQLIDKANG